VFKCQEQRKADVNSVTEHTWKVDVLGIWSLGKTFEGNNQGET
jgi:hypothetical protein